MLDQRHVEHFLTAEEQARFETDGFLTISNALDDDTRTQVTASVDTIYDEFRTSGFDPYAERAFDATAALFHSNLLWRDQSFVSLLDHPTTFPKVLGLLGWNIYCYHTHMIVNPPSATDAVSKFGFHRDSGRANFELGGDSRTDPLDTPSARLSVKIAYWLSDLSRPGRANLYVVPGSHRDNRPSIPRDGSASSAAVPVIANPGDATIFDRRLWHSSSRNESTYTRKALFYGYGYRWIRPKDDMTIDAAVMAKNDPIRRQLLGASPDNNRRYSPRPGDTPIKDWLVDAGLSAD